MVTLMVLGVPEPPRCLQAHGRNDEAQQVLCDVSDGGPGRPKVAKEQAEVPEALVPERECGKY